MLSFLIFVICLLAACLAFLVWSFWPVLQGKDFTRFERDVEEQERREFQAAVATRRPALSVNDLPRFRAVLPARQRGH